MRYLASYLTPIMLSQLRVQIGISKNDLKPIDHTKPNNQIDLRVYHAQNVISLSLHNSTFSLMYPTVYFQIGKQDATSITCIPGLAIFANVKMLWNARFTAVILQWSTISCLTRSLLRNTSLWKNLPSRTSPPNPFSYQRRGAFVNALILMSASSERAKYTSPGWRPGWCMLKRNFKAL